MHLAQISLLFNLVSNRLVEVWYYHARLCRSFDHIGRMGQTELVDDKGQRKWLFNVAGNVPTTTRFMTAPCLVTDGSAFNCGVRLGPGHNLNCG